MLYLLKLLKLMTNVYSLSITQKNYILPITIITAKHKQSWDLFLLGFVLWFLVVGFLFHLNGLFWCFLKKLNCLVLCIFGCLPTTNSLDLLTNSMCLQHSLTHPTR